MTVSNPVGVFDSGVGGLSVLREIRRELPAENLIYVADSAHAPYGEKTQDYIERRSIAISEFLLNLQAKAIVVACNTATGAAVATIRSRYPIPIVAMEPAIKPAAAQSRTGVIGVLATQRTLASNNFIWLFERYGKEVDILPQACPGLVEQVEAGDLDGPKTRRLIERYVEPLLRRGADVLVLGCTHYPFLAETIREIAGPSVAVIDSGGAVARQLQRRLAAAGLLTEASGDGYERFWSSADSGESTAIIGQLWQADVSVAQMPDAAIVGSEDCVSAG